MLFPRKSWLWLYIRVGVLLGHKLGDPEQHEKNNCYQLNRLYCNFQEAEEYCRAQRGHLVHTWNPELQAFIQSSWGKETMWWVGENLRLLRRSPEMAHPGDAPVFGLCTSVVTRSDETISERDQCSMKHHFICQTDAFPQHGADSGRNRYGPWGHKRKRGVQTQTNMTSGGVPLPATCHQRVPPDRSRTLCFPVHPFSSVLPKATPKMIMTSPTRHSQVTSATPIPSSPSQVTSVTSAPNSSSQVTSVTITSSSPPQMTSATTAPNSSSQVTPVTSAPNSPPQVTPVTSAPNSSSQVTSAISTPSSPPQMTSATTAPNSSSQVTSAISTPSSPPQMTSATTAPNSSSQVTPVTSAPNSPPQVTSVISAPNSSSQVTPITSAPNSSSQVTSAISTPSSPPQMTSATTAPNSSSQVTSVSSAPNNPPQVTSVTPVPNSPPQVTSTTLTPNTPPQVTSVTPTPSSPLQVTPATTAPNSSSQLTPVTSAPNSSSQVTSVTITSSSPPQMTSATTAPNSSSQVTPVTSAPNSPPQVTSVISAPNSSSQVTSVTPTLSSPPQMTSATTAPNSSSQVTSVSSVPNSPPQVTSVTPVPNSPPQVTSTTLTPNTPPQVTSATPTPSSPLQVTSATTAPNSPQQVTSATTAPSSPPQVTSATPTPSSPPQVTSATPTPSSSSQVTSAKPTPSSSSQVMPVTSAPNSSSQVTSVTSAPNSPPQVTSATTAPSSPPQMTSATPTPSSPPQVTSASTAPSSPPQMTSATPTPSSPPQVTSVTPVPSSPPQVTSSTPTPSSPPQVTSATSALSRSPQVTSAKPVPNSPPWPTTTEITRFESTISTRRSLTDTTSSTKEDSNPKVISAHPQRSFQSTANQVTDQTAENLILEIPTFQAHSEFQKACGILQRLRNFPPTSPTPAQVSVANLLIDLSKQLLIPYQKNVSWNVTTPEVICLLQPLGSSLTTKEESQQRLHQGTEKVEDMLEMSLIALGEIHKAFCQRNQTPESAVTLTSPVATTVLSSQNVSSLPLSTYTLGEPAPLRLGFPSAEALKELLNKHPGVNLQVTGLAFNPFETPDDRNIVGSIGNVLLSSDYQSLQVRDLIEDIEIILWRNASMETQPTNFNTSTDHFTITVNITSIEKTLIVTIEPENPLLMTLYLGFQDEPGHTRFYLNTSLPRDQVWQKDEEYTWVLTPESLKYGIGTYYIMAVVTKSTEATQHTPSPVSVVTAVTQCYFWDTNSRTWRSDGCQVGLQSTIWKTQCLCNHLTFFSSDFFIVPRTVDLENTIKLLLHVTDNPVGVSLLASLLGFYILLVTWAWKKDQADIQKVKVTVLADNDPSSAFQYLIQVYTGYRRRAATTAQHNFIHTEPSSSKIFWLSFCIFYVGTGPSFCATVVRSNFLFCGCASLSLFCCFLALGIFGDLKRVMVLLDKGLGMCTCSDVAQNTEMVSITNMKQFHFLSHVFLQRYVSQVIISDMTVRKKWHFQCNCWLAVDLGSCERDRVFTPASREELSTFRHLFSSTIIEKFTEDYLWLSVATRHPWSQFTRVQRLSCCMTLLLCDMVINVMFWKMGGTTARRGPFAVTWSEMLTSVQTAIILFPIHLVFGRLFQLIHPPESLPPLPPTQAARPLGLAYGPPALTQVVKELKDMVGFLLRRNSQLLLKCEQSSWSSCDVNKLVTLLSSLMYCHLEDQGCPQQTDSPREDAVSENHHYFCRYLLQAVRRLKSHLIVLGAAQVHQPCDLSGAVSQLQNLQELLETQTLPREQGPWRNSTSFPILSLEEREKPMSFCLFRWLMYGCWFLLGVISLVSAFFITLYSLELNKDQATSWVISMMLTVLQDIFISQPIKVIFLTFLFSVTANQIPWLNKEKEQHANRIVALWAKCSSSASGLRDKNNPIYTAPAMTNWTKHPRRAWKKFFKLTGGSLVQILFLSLLMAVVYSARDSRQFLLHQALWKRFSHRFSEIKLLKDFYPWANHTLLPSLYGDHRGFITDGNSFLLGNVLLRQIRIPNDTLFPVSLHEQGNSHIQHQEDRKNYGAGWGPPDTNITDTDSIWHYQNQELLGSYPTQGEFATYSGGGYVVRLGRNSSTAARVLRHLEQRHWLDHCTKVLFVELTVFNANVNLLCAVTLILESNSVGTFFTALRLDSLTSLQTSERGFAWILSQITYYLLVCYYTFIQGYRLKRQRWGFFTRKRNLLDTSIILISFSILGLNIQCLSLLHKNMLQYRCDRDRFISFSKAIKVNSAVTHLMGFLVLLATVQLWDLLRHNAQLQIISKTLNKAWDEVVGFILIITILLSSYAMTFNLMFGWSISDYQSFFSSAVTIVGLLMGISNHKEVIALYPILGSFLVLTGIILMGLVIINLFVSAILTVFGKERKALEKEATLTDMLLQKLSSLLGIRQHQTPSSDKHADNTGY